MWQSTSIKKCTKGLREDAVRTYSLGLSWRQPRKGIYGASIWTSQSLIPSRLAPTYRTSPLRLPSPFTSMKFLKAVAVLHPGRPSVSKSVSAHLRLPNKPTTWRPDSPWSAQAAGRAPAPSAKLLKDADPKRKWSRSAWLSLREWAERGLPCSDRSAAFDVKWGCLAKESGCPICADH